MHRPTIRSIVRRQLAAPLCVQRTKTSLYVVALLNKLFTGGLASQQAYNAHSASSTDKIPNTIPENTTTAERYPRSIQALHLKPLKREAELGLPACDLQLRSYSLQPLEFFCDFALRAAYYLGLPASGPVPLPRITQRWTVPKSHFIFKKAQENFERITLRRMIQVKDGNPETVQLWLAYLRKHQYWGVGMKANMWEFSELGADKIMDQSANTQKADMEKAWEHMGQLKQIGKEDRVGELLANRRYKETTGLRQAPIIDA